MTYPRKCGQVRGLADQKGKCEEMKQFISATLHEGDNRDKYHRWTEGLTPEQMQSRYEWEQKTCRGREQNRSADPFRSPALPYPGPAASWATGSGASDTRP
ncbi:MAG TPA: hypothetical protein VM658_13290 [bacterium]|nr:hypothetical protein [bacterium]